MFTNVNAAAVAVASTDAVAVFNVENTKTLGIQVKNTGAAALDAFELWGKVSPSADAVKFSGVATDYTSPVYPVLKASASPVALAAGGNVWLFVNTEGLSEVQIRASSAVAATTLKINAAQKFTMG